MEDKIFVVEQMLKNRVAIENIPLLVFNNNNSETIKKMVNSLDQMFEKYNTFPALIRRSKLILSVPTTQDNETLLNFFEKFNSQSRFQNYTYGVACLDFGEWMNLRELDRRMLSRIYDFILNKRHNTYFFFTNAPKLLISEIDRSNNSLKFIIQRESYSILSEREFIKKIMGEYKIKVSDSQLNDIAHLLSEKNQSAWNTIVQSIAIDIYAEGDFKLNNKKQMDSLEIGFRL